jgi:hypothetical protein
MSNKNLLNEAQVRQFMKLASLQPLRSGFVHGLTERGSRAGDEGSVAAGKKGDADYSGKGEREGDESETHEGEDLEESHARGRDEGPAGYGATLDAGRAGARLRELDAPPGEEEEFAADDLAGGSPEEDEEAAVDLDVAAEEEPGLDAGAEEPTGTVDVDQFLDLLKDALAKAVSEVTGEETEVDVADDVGVEDDEVEADAPGAEEMEMDVEMSADEGDAPLEEDTTTALVERITKRVAARILKSALTAKK